MANITDIPTMEAINSSSTPIQLSFSKADKGITDRLVQDQSPYREISIPFLLLETKMEREMTQVMKEFRIIWSRSERGFYEINSSGMEDDNVIFHIDSLNITNINALGSNVFDDIRTTRTGKLQNVLTAIDSAMSSLGFSREQKDLILKALKYRIAIDNISGDVYFLSA